MNLNFNKIFKLTFTTAAALTLASCSNDESETPATPDTTTTRSYHLVLGQGSTKESTTYTQGATLAEMQDPNKTFSFTGFGFEVPSTRTARVYASNDGETIYNLNYGGGAVTKFSYNGGQNYKQLLNTDIQAVMGTAYPRWTKIDDKYAMLQHVFSEEKYDATGVIYQRTATTVKLARINLETMTVEENATFEFPWTEAEATQGVYVSRIDAPVVASGKLYYGAAKSKYDPITAAKITMEYQDVETLVVDYPSLKMPRTIRTDVDNVAGSTNGYRTPVAHKDEDGAILQLITSNGATITKIKNGVYDTSYGTFNIAQALGYKAEANTGWFYAGNGIGYVPVLNTDLGGSSSSNWDLIRVDINKKTAVKMNIPFAMWLRQYQWASVIEGKLYMALTPIGGEGNIYIFDPASTSADGFKVGAKLKTGTDAFYLGVY
ncbi:hypothetical protein [Flavobacterium sp. TAB 87]|uniref:hypothetical protein n=1 Tax=Flavobacterium sp. TAB 87 TaxID=1729581 RepID=UPI00076D7FBB|nr:hypothetical protein [Flavobacterium sp. TAB 87]KVV15937.1 hypothetical protein AP058_00555 [Flavobacterium sp. TAB 87]